MDEDIIKAPHSADGFNAQKIKYLNEAKTESRYYAPSSFIIAVVLAAFNCYRYIKSPANITATEIFRIALVPAIFIIIGVVAIIYDRKKIEGLSPKIQRIRTQGTKTTGEIIKINKRKMWQRKHRVTCYYYTVQYSDPNTHEGKTFDTPLIDGYPCIQDSDLPLRATVYILDDEVRVDEIIDAPTAAVKERIATQSITFAVVSVVLIAIFILMTVYVASGR